MNDYERIASVFGFDGSRSGVVSHHTASRRGERVGYATFDETHVFAKPPVSRTAAIESRLATLEAELADIKRFGEDDYKDGDVLTFKGDFNGSKTYSYAAIKAGGRWHLTGGRAVQNATWDALVEFMRGANVRKVRKVTETERVV